MFPLIHLTIFVALEEIIVELPANLTLIVYLPAFTFGLKMIIPSEFVVFVYDFEPIVILNKPLKIHLLKA